jgi:hypothetical protein
LGVLLSENLICKGYGFCLVPDMCNGAALIMECTIISIDEICLH